MKIITIVGARPQFIKAAAVSRVLEEHYSDKIQEIMIHTGQHYDENMSKIFFNELGISPPLYNLKISGGEHGDMTGRMIIEIEKLLISEKPDSVLVYGDTNSTLAAAIAAVKLNIPLFHVEAGLRSFNMSMPEEVNRILTDRVSSLLFCPTDKSVENLKNEGIENGVFNVGDVMYDIAIYYRDLISNNNKIISNKMNQDEFILTTIHRAENTNNPERLKSIVDALELLSHEFSILLPLHPRTRKLLIEYNLIQKLDNTTLIQPLSYLDMIELERSARVILTDSGGVQKEAFFYNVPCVTMRDETEWVETVDLGWNRLVGANSEKIIKHTRDFYKNPPIPSEVKPYGYGDAANKIVEKIYN